MVDLEFLVQSLRVIVPLLYGVVAAGYVVEFYKNRDRHFSWTTFFFIAGVCFHFLLLVVLFLQQTDCRTIRHSGASFSSRSLPQFSFSEWTISSVKYGTGHSFFP